MTALREKRRLSRYGVVKPQEESSSPLVHQAADLPQWNWHGLDDQGLYSLAFSVWTKFHKVVEHTDEEEAAQAFAQRLVSCASKGGHQAIHELLCARKKEMKMCRDFLACVRAEIQRRMPGEASAAFAEIAKVQHAMERCDDLVAQMDRELLAHGTTGLIAWMARRTEESSDWSSSCDREGDICSGADLVNALTSSFRFYSMQVTIKLTDGDPFRVHCDTVSII